MAMVGTKIKEETEAMPMTWTDKDGDNTDDDNPPDEADSRRERRGGEGEGREKIVRLLSRSFKIAEVKTENEGSVTQRTRDREMNREMERDNEERGRGRVIRLRHRCFLKHCSRGRCSQEEEEERGITEDNRRAESEIRRETQRRRYDKENDDNNNNDCEMTVVKKMNTCDDNSDECVVRHIATPHTTTTTTTFTTLTPSATSAVYTPSTRPRSYTYPSLPHQNQHPVHPWHPYHPTQHQRQPPAYPYIPYQTTYRHTMPNIPFPAPVNAAHPTYNTLPAHAEGISANGVVCRPNQRPLSPSYSKDYITSLAFLARVNHVARALADRSVDLNDLPQCPSPALHLLLPQPCHPPSSLRQDNSPHDLQCLQETLALCAGVGKGVVTTDLRHYCKSLMLAVLCPRSPQHEIILVESSLHELEGSVYKEHCDSQVNYCWRLASSLCLILERLGWVPSAQ